MPEYRAYKWSGYYYSGESPSVWNMTWKEKNSVVEVPLWYGDPKYKEYSRMFDLNTIPVDPKYPGDAALGTKQEFQLDPNAMGVLTLVGIVVVIAAIAVCCWG